MERLRPLRQLRPAKPGTPRRPNNGDPGERSGAVTKRQLIANACQTCRKRKVKCDGKQPVCAFCARKRLNCEYAMAEGGGGALSFRLYKQSSALQDKNQKLRELYSLLQQLPEVEARDVFHRIRVNDDPLSVLQHVREARLLLAS